MARQERLKSKDEHRGLRLDAKDIENIRNALEIYDRMNPRGKVHVSEDGRYIEYCNIADHLEYIRKAVKQGRRLKSLTSHKIGQDPLVLRLSIPPSLEAWLAKGYPTLFSDKEQTDQFLKAFPAFDLTK